MLCLVCVVCCVMFVVNCHVFSDRCELLDVSYHMLVDVCVCLMCVV